MAAHLAPKDVSATVAADPRPLRFVIRPALRGDMLHELLDTAQHVRRQVMCVASLETVRKMAELLNERYPR